MTPAQDNSAPETSNDAPNAAAVQPANMQQDMPAADQQNGDIASQAKRGLRERGEKVTYNEDALEAKVYKSAAAVQQSAPKRQRLNSGRAAQKPLDIALPAGDVDLEENTAEAVHLPLDMLAAEEENMLPDEADKSLYIRIRNKVLTEWRKDVTRWLTEEMLLQKVKNKQLHPYYRVAWTFLSTFGYINFGVAPSFKLNKTKVKASSKTVLVIGAGLAGLAAARQLHFWGYNVLVLEGRDRIGGRVYSLKMEADHEGTTHIGTADMGGSIITGVDGNPLAVLAKQLGIPMYQCNGQAVPFHMESKGGKGPNKQDDDEVQEMFDRLQQEATDRAKELGGLEDHISLGTALTVLFEENKEAFDTAERQQLFQWHMANIEFSSAMLASKLSLPKWAMDDAFEFGGHHVWLPGGNVRLATALAEGVPIMYNTVVNAVRYAADGVEVDTDGLTYTADAVIVTAPLGVLKRNKIQFDPPLPVRKQEAIQRLGYGILNKVVLLFPECFWTPWDMFGFVAENEQDRGKYYLFYQYNEISGAAVLAALVAGEAAVRHESVEAKDAVEGVMRVLRMKFEKKGVVLPSPLKAVCTRWGSDPMSYGSYSSVIVGGLGAEDYDILAENIGGRLFFAGEATISRYPATMHGAYISGLREAANVQATLYKLACEKAEREASSSDSDSSEDEEYKLQQQEQEKRDREAADRAWQFMKRLHKLFNDSQHPPDVEIGCCQAVLGEIGSEFECLALLRVDIGSIKHGPRRHVPMHLLVPRSLLDELQDLPTDEDRIQHILKVPGTKMVGRGGQNEELEAWVTAVEVARRQGVNGNAR